MYKQLDRKKNNRGKTINASVKQKKKDQANNSCTIVDNRPENTAYTKLKCSTEQYSLRIKVPNKKRTQMKSLKGVIQCGGKYESIKKLANKDVDESDYTYKSVSEKDYLEAANEIIGEYLSAGFLDRKGKTITAPKAMISTGWGGVEGLLLIPERINGISCMLGDDTFTSSTTHELGHMISDGEGKMAGMKVEIEKIAGKAGAEADKKDYQDILKLDRNAWIEECRADLTGVFLKITNEKVIPLIDSYSTLNGEPADNQHPPGDFRINLIKEYIAKSKI
jgi:hypothetical protein